MRVVDLMRAGVVEVLALQIDLRAAAMVGQALRQIKRRRPADIMLEVIGHRLGEFGIALGGVIGALDLEDQRHQRLGDITAAEHAKKPALVGPRAKGIGRGHVLGFRGKLPRVQMGQEALRAGDGASQHHISFVPGFRIGGVCHEGFRALKASARDE